MSENRKRGRPPKYATKEQLQTIGEYVDFFKSDYGSRYISSKVVTAINDLHRSSMLFADTGVYTPILSEQFLQEIGFQSLSSSSEELARWLQNPTEYDTNLRKLSNYLENSVEQYGRAISLLSDIKSYNYDLRCATTDLEDKINDESFKRSYNNAMSTLRKLNIPYQIRRLDKKVCEDGVAFVWFKKHKDYIELLDLPTDFCYITAPWSYGYLFALDLTYFDRFAFIDNQVPELFEAYRKFCEMRQKLANTDEIVPYQYYPISPMDGWCCVFDNTRPLKIPPMIGSASSALDSLSYRDLIKEKALIDLYRILAFKIPTNNTTGKMTITYKEASGFINAIKDSIPENFISIASPFDVAAPINADQTNVMESLQNISNKGFYDYSAIPNALFNSDLKSAAALKLATNTLFSYSSSGLYSSMQNLVNWILRIECGSKYDWHIVFHGNKLYEDEEKAEAIKMLQSANAPISYVMSRFGFEPFDIENMYVIENKIGIKDKMKPILMSAQMTSGPGAPEKLDSEKSESSDMVEDAGL